ncbi:transcription factor bHLH162-like [Durio zibethinus]|uniref:Transcription factor bHLH162-like n=1 Tax=Durio zibethinus TaxID=66656 RepID=A0A6P5Z8T4_DURZI|nr:transcription factor bHLH162-like [Durio zibethinus]
MKFQMEYLVHDLGVNKGMKRSRCSSAKVERKIIEKNRRNHMKNLYSRLNSLLPHHNSKEPLSLPDQIDEAVNFIKSLETSLKESREKKDSLMGRKRSYRCTNTASLRSPEIRINEKGSAIEVAWMTGQDSQFMFYKMIRILHVEGAEVLNVSFRLLGIQFSILFMPRLKILVQQNYNEETKQVCAWIQQRTGTPAGAM